MAVPDAWQEGSAEVHSHGHELRARGSAAPSLQKEKTVPSTAVAGGLSKVFWLSVEKKQELPWEPLGHKRGICRDPSLPPNTEGAQWASCMKPWKGGRPEL
jgi:hypothetical protein